MSNIFKQKGFTLIEIVVSAGIFGVIMLIVVGMFSRFTLVQRYSIAQQGLSEDIRFAMELISREVRTGYGSTFEVLPTGDGVSFRNQNGACVGYKLIDEKIERAEVAGLGDDCSLRDGAWTAITSEKTQIQGIRWDVTPARVNQDGLPENQGFITISLKAQSTAQLGATLNLQTTITSRQVAIYSSETNL